MVSRAPSTLIASPSTTPASSAARSTSTPQPASPFPSKAAISTDIPTSTPQPTASETSTPVVLPPWTRPQDGMLMVYVPEGEFRMGSNDISDAEKPVHTVYTDA
jgi:formylglycine-generating enzyme required for sulfatase activity